MKTMPEPSKVAGANSSKQTQQWILVGILTLVLVGVLFFSSAKEDTSEAEVSESTGQPADVATLAPEPSRSNDAVKLSDEITQVRQLNRISLDRIVALDPLAADSLASEMVPAEPEPPVEDEEADLESQRAEPVERERPSPPVRVQAVYGSGRGAAALVEQDIVRPGQPLSDGRKVLEVSREGVRVGGPAEPPLRRRSGPPARLGDGLEIYDFGTE